jgi:hypothetical protein
MDHLDHWSGRSCGCPNADLKIKEVGSEPLKEILHSASHQMPQSCERPGTGPESTPTAVHSWQTGRRLNDAEGARTDDLPGPAAGARPRTEWLTLMASIRLSPGRSLLRSRHHLRREELGLVHEQIDGRWLLVRWVAVAGEQAADRRAHPGSHLFLFAPVDGRIAAD